jgi:hypothetical protein
MQFVQKQNRPDSWHLFASGRPGAEDGSHEIKTCPEGNLRLTCASNSALAFVPACGANGMRKSSLWILPLLTFLAGISFWREFRPGLIKAQEAGAGSSAPFTFRITFGHKDPAPTSWDGSLGIENGRIDTLNGWRILEQDSAGVGGWKITSARVR